MGTTIPPDLKGVAPYIKRAEELDKDSSHGESPVVAYYCRQYAMELGIELREQAKDPETVGQFLLGLIETLESAKEKISISRDEGEQIVYKFAMDVFARADAEDRGPSGAGKATARTFYAASVFMDTLKQFGERGDEVDEKCRYAKWKAADILKAIKEGRAPAAGGPNEPTVDDIPVAPGTSSPPSYGDLPSDNVSLPKIDPPVPVSPPPSTVSPPPSREPPPPTVVAPSVPSVVPSAPFAPPKPMSRGNAGVSDTQIEDALEYARFAIAALEIKDANLAIHRLQGALAVLQQ